MTTFVVPPAGDLDWREIHRTPPNARLYTVGPYCPLDDTTLRARLDGFICPVCWASWNCHGLAGRWLPQPGAPVGTWWGRPLMATLAVGFGCGGSIAVALGSTASDRLSVVLVWTATVVLLAAAGTMGLLARRAARSRRAGSELSEACAGAAPVPAAAGDGSHGRRRFGRR